MMLYHTASDTVHCTMLGGTLTKQIYSKVRLHYPGKYAVT